MKEENNHTENNLTEKEVLKGAMEAVIFAAGEPLDIESLAQILNIVPDAVEELADELTEEYSGNRRGISLLRFEGKLQFSTSRNYSSYVKKLSTVNERQTLSKGALECLAITAYKQPVTRVEIDEIRGVSSDYVLSKLVERGLIRTQGRKDAPGRPLLYVTTDEFLKQFDFASVKSFTSDPEYSELINQEDQTEEENPENTENKNKKNDTDLTNDTNEKKELTDSKTNPGE